MEALCRLGGGGRDGNATTLEVRETAMEALVARLLRVFAVALGGDADFFRDKCDKHVTNLVALRYPPVARSDGDERETERVKPHKP